MSEHKGSIFSNSCVRVPLDPCSRQPTPSYERPEAGRKETEGRSCCSREKDRGLRGLKVSAKTAVESFSDSASSGSRETVESFLEFFHSIPDYGEVHHLSSEEFRQKVDYLKRKQRSFLSNLKLPWTEPVEGKSLRNDGLTGRQACVAGSASNSDLELKGKKCYLEQSKTFSSMYPSARLSVPDEDQDTVGMYRWKGKCRSTEERGEPGKEAKCGRVSDSVNKARQSGRKAVTLVGFSSEDSQENSEENSEDESIETKSLPAAMGSSRQWHPTVPKPFSFTLREDAEKYMAQVEKSAEKERGSLSIGKKKAKAKKRHARAVPLTSKVPLYDKLLAEKEERSRIVREESALNLLSQVRPFRLECERRAWKSLTRSSPELRSGEAARTGCGNSYRRRGFLGSRQLYDRILQDEYSREMTKKIRAAKLMNCSARSRSMAERDQRLKHVVAASEDDKASLHTRTSLRTDSNGSAADGARNGLDGSGMCLLSDSAQRLRPAGFSRSRSATSLLPTRGTNLAVILRCQASREKLEREIQEEMAEKRREEAVKLRESLIGRKPVWRALRSAARRKTDLLNKRHEHKWDLDMRTWLRRDEAREQAQRHRFQMQMMQDRVMRIPTLFERHSQNYQSSTRRTERRRKKTKSGVKVTKKRDEQSSSGSSSSSRGDSIKSFRNASRPDSGSLTSSASTLHSFCRSSDASADSACRESQKSVLNSGRPSSRKKRPDRGQLKVSINETAELIKEKSDATGSTISLRQDGCS